MNRKLLVLSLFGAIVCSFTPSFASYIDQITDQSAEWIGNPTRTAATDSVDCVTYNPAGTVKMLDGLHVHFSNQTIDNNNTTAVKSDTYMGQKRYDTHKPSKYVPSLYVNYKKDDWAAYAGVHIIGGGGSTFWANGSPNLNLAVQIVDSKFGWGSSGTKNVYWDSSTPYAQGANVSVDMLSMFPALTIGGAYRVNDMMTVSLGGRVIEGSQTIELKVTKSGLGSGFEKTTVYDGKWTATGYMGIIGVNVQPASNLNLAMTFESMSKMNWKVDVNEDLSVATPAFGGEQALSSMSGYTDGRKFRFDLPAKLMLGAEYVVTPEFKVALSGLVYFPNWGTYEKPTASTPITAGAYKQNLIKYDFDTAWELGVGFDWQFLKNIHWTGGVNYDRMNVKDEYLSEILNKIDLWNVGTGIKIRTEENLNLMVSYMHNFYITASNNATKQPTAPPRDYTYHKTEYSKYANVISFSIEYKFL